MWGVLQKKEIEGLLASFYTAAASYERKQLKLETGSIPADKMSFAKWMDEQKLNQDRKESDEETGFLGGFSLAQASVAAQMQELNGALPDTNGLTGVEFRQRMQHAIYLLLASIGFGALALLVGLPTLVLKPSKFIIFLTLCTLCAVASVIILKKPSVFLSNLIEGGLSEATPLMAVISAMMFTLYTVFSTRKYVYVMFAGGAQVLSIAYYLSSFIPGGSMGLKLLLRSAYTLVCACLTPCKIYARSFASQIMS